MYKYSISICSIIRDGEKNLHNNIKRIEALRKNFKDSEVIIFENDSKDNTRNILKKWKNSSFNIKVLNEDFNTKTITQNNNGVNKYFTKSRISKMALYRNRYMKIINSNNFQRDYVLVIDLDIKKFNIKNILDCFKINNSWDCITANGFSISSRFSKQYHDSYALCEFGTLNKPQKESEIRLNRRKFSFLKPGMPLIPVHSAFGGLAIYKWEAIKGLYYEVIPNNDSRVEVRCEHYGLHRNMIEKGYNNIYINPDLLIKYRTVNLSLFIQHIRERFFE